MKPPYDKLNFGCGTRFANNWTNIDFHSENAQVQRVNLLAGFPFADETFQAVYSSHVLEHFDRRQGAWLLQESRRVLRPGGILRIVVPDLQAGCAEYLRILALPDGAAKRQLYEWSLLELLDQLVRVTPSGDMGRFIDRVMAGKDEAFKQYIRERTENIAWSPPQQPSFPQKLKKLTPQKLATKMSEWYVAAVARLLPASLRNLVLIRTPVGERHRWMYDAYGLRLMFADAGFSNIRALTFNESAIPGFNADRLDSNPDGQPYKNNSVYLEGTK